MFLTLKSDRLQVAWTFQSPPSCIFDRLIGGMDYQFLTRPYLLSDRLQMAWTFRPTWLYLPSADWCHRCSLTHPIVGPAFLRLYPIGFRSRGRFSPRRVVSSIGDWWHGLSVPHSTVSSIRPGVWTFRPNWMYLRSADWCHRRIVTHPTVGPTFLWLYPIGFRSRGRFSPHRVVSSIGQ
jgi:hypothetical protein